MHVVLKKVSNEFLFSLIWFRLLLILQTSGKTSADEWETNADEWKWVKMNERQVQTSKDESKTNERRVQTSEDEQETSAVMFIFFEY